MSNRICVAALSGLLAAACVRIDGGAVEVSWVVRSTDGRAITDCSCANPPISRVHIDLVGVNGDIAGTNPCAGRAECEFPCERQTGSTPFDINPGTAGLDGLRPQYQISVSAVDAAGHVLTSVMSPASILRSVVKGQPTEVEAFLLVADCDAQNCSGTNISAPCSRP